MTTSDLIHNPWFFIAVFGAMSLAGIIKIIWSICVGSFDREKLYFRDIKNTAESKFIKSYFGVLKKWNAKKIMIVECVCDFYMNRQVASAVFADNTAITNPSLYSYTSNGKTYQIHLGSGYYDSLLNRVYGMVEQAFQEAGYTLVPKKELISNKKFQLFGSITAPDDDIDSDDPDIDNRVVDFDMTMKNYARMIAQGKKMPRSFKASVEGLVVLPEVGGGRYSDYSRIDCANKYIEEIAKEIGADSVMRIYFAMANNMGKNCPVLQDFTLDIHPANGNTYEETESVFFTKKKIVSQDDVGGDSVDMRKYDEAFMKIISSVVGIMKCHLKM